MASTVPPDFPPIFLLPTHLDPATLHDLEEKIPSLTYDINEAEIILGNISKPERALFELRHRKVVTEPVSLTNATYARASKRRKLSHPLATRATEDTGLDDDNAHRVQVLAEERETHREEASSDADTVKVVKLSWLTDSLDNATLLPLAQYVLYEGRRVGAATRPGHGGSQILSRAVGDSPQPNRRLGSRPLERLHHQKQVKAHGLQHPPALVRHSTSEQEADNMMPPIPAFLHTTYSCERPTPVDPPNKSFIEELKKIRTTRLLIGDQIGVRAYSTAIASLSAYPYEVASRPGE
jgi:DNA polymerase IV